MSKTATIRICDLPGCTNPIKDATSHANEYKHKYCCRDHYHQARVIPDPETAYATIIAYYGIKPTAEIAEITGLSRVHVTRTTRKLIERGIIKAKQPAIKKSVTAKKVHAKKPKELKPTPEPKQKQPKYIHTVNKNKIEYMPKYETKVEDTTNKQWVRVNSKTVVLRRRQ